MTERPRLVLGTAGHIDHGKTSLIRALTGVDPDRLPEEQERGITIELGFAPLVLGDITLGVVDVPGHEKLVRTMVSGATGIDLVLLVVAADEGVMPQTREHVAVCELLGIERGVVALTKCDLADADLADLAELEARELLGTSALADAPFVRVSARNGDGIPELRQALETAVSDADSRTRRDGPARLSVDRSFSARGFGSIVTGTLVGDSLATGDEVELFPDSVHGRIRGLQSFGETAEVAPPGVRCAVNIQGVDLEQIERGQVLAKPGSLFCCDSFDAEIRWLEDSPLVESQCSVSILCGTTEVLGRLSPLGSPQLKPGETRFARIHLEKDRLPLIPGDRLILRGFSRNPKVGATLGGGTVIDVSPLRRRHSDPALVEQLEELSRANPADGLAVRISRAGFAGVSENQLALVTGQSLATVTSLLAERSDVLRASSSEWLATRLFERFESALLAGVSDYHQLNPIRPGIPRSTLAAALPENAAPGTFELSLTRLCENGRLEVSEGTVRDPEHLPMLSQREEVILSHIRAEVMSKELEPPTFREWMDLFKTSEEELRDLLAFLVREGTLVQAPTDLWFDAVAVEQLRNRVRELLICEGELDTQRYKDLIGTTRKYAVPLMELFDGERITVRRGEVRVPGPAARRASDG